MKPQKIFIIAGESSGDSLGARLLHDLKENLGDIEIQGIGGPLMEKEGLKSLFPMEELSLMGVFEILPKVYHLLKRIDETAAAVRDFDPDLLITIDSPDFCFRVTKRVQALKAKKIHYVAPTVWAWRPGRAKKVAKIYDDILCLFPFEPRYFEKEGMNAHFVGHPFMSSPILSGSNERFRKEYNISQESELLGVFFGSRRSELKRIGPVFAETAGKWLEQKSGRRLIIPTLPHLKPMVEELVAPFHQNCIIVENYDHKPDAFAAIDKAIAVSGTIGLELSICGIPHIIGYKAHPLTYLIVRQLVNVNYAHLTNIILKKGVIPEFIQEACTANNLLVGLNSVDKQNQENAFERVKNALVSQQSAAQAILTSVY